MYYSQLSDFEINKRVADIALNGTWHVKPSHPENKTGGWLYGSNGVYTRDLPDYCTSPDDAWPLVTKNKISLVWIDVTNGAIVIHTQRLKSDPGGNLLS
ncbi:phage protein NinX family protein [Salmonella enterica subsp. enterica serovar Rochdale]|uniref:phage protein NinX family protein n=1 Tax=Salmonella enterica TaxID=28901 RepID=UPI003F897DF5